MHNSLNVSATTDKTLTNIQVFENSEFGKVRTITLNDKPYFVGKDVALILGYAKPENAVSNHVDEDDKTTTLIQGDGSNYKSKTTIINESGLYALILSSKLPTAKKFKHWVTAEVLPSLRKNGGYINNQENLSEAELMAKAVLVAQKVIAEKDRQIADMAPKANVYDKICNSETLKPVDTVASNLGYGKNNFFALMRGMGIFHYSTKDTDGRKYNLPKQEYLDRGYFVTKEVPFIRGDDNCLYTKIFVTGKGEAWLTHRLTADVADKWLKKEMGL